MKKGFKTLLLSSLIVLGALGSCFADIMPPNSHPVKKCIKIIENPDLKDIALYAKITGPMIGEEIKPIEYNTCLNKGYKFNIFHLIVQKNGEEIDLGRLETRGGYLPNSNPKTEENLTYQIVQNGKNYELEIFQKDKKADMGMIKESYEQFWIILLLTILIETIVLILLTKVIHKEEKLSYKKLIFAGIFCSFATLPYLRFVGRETDFYMSYSYFNYMVGGEIFVFLIEAILLKNILEISRTKALIYSLICNALSFGIGLLVL